MRRRDDVVDTLRQRVVSGVHFGTLESNARLPSARSLARELHADARVILDAYARLEREGLVTRRRNARGYFVAPAPSSTVQVAPSAEWLVDIFEHALQQGIHAPRLAEHVQRSLETVRLNAVCVECNTDQIDWLCGELQDDYGIRSSPIEPSMLDGSPAALATMRRADVIVTTAAHAADVRRAARAVDRPCVVATLRREITDEVQRTLRSAPVYFICADLRYAEKLKRLYATAPGARNLRTIVLGWQDPATIPPGAAVWMLRTARAQLGGVPQHVRALPTLRLFSAETTRALLSFVVRANAAAVDGMAARRVGPLKGHGAS
jgi:DNA-binding transcriptional regulator YhcF (GntR family)